MGNNRSRVAPSRRLHILDSQTRARYQNQRELIQLRAKLKDIRIEHNETLSRLAFDRHDVKTKLRELQHEQGQKELYKKFDKNNRQSSTISIDESDITTESDVSTVDSSSLLLHNLKASMEWEKSIILSNKTNLSDTFEKRRLEYSSKRNARYGCYDQTDSILLSNSLSLKQHSERMKSSIQIAVARAARDSHTAARRGTHAY